MTPPSTSQMAPVTQLVAGESRNVMVLARSRTGAAHHVDSEVELDAVRQTGVQPWPGGEKDLFIRIVPDRVTGRRISRAGRS